jgi:adenosylmethionine-8-amino-7-oxononanoate aminotransferase
VRPDIKAFGTYCADRIAEAIEFEGPDTVAAVFLEPVQNAGGCFPPPPGYFERVREICDEYDVLLVSDEVICAYGRIGSMFACDDFGARHDHLREGPQVGLLPDRRNDRQRQAV